MSISIVNKRAMPAAAKSIACRSWLAPPLRAAKHQMVRSVERRQIRRDARALLAMDDRTLADIGLRRCEVEYAALYGRLSIVRLTGDDR